MGIKNRRPIGKKIFLALSVTFTLTVGPMFAHHELAPLNPTVTPNIPDRHEEATQATEKSQASLLAPGLLPPTDVPGIGGKPGRVLGFEEGIGAKYLGDKQSFPEMNSQDPRFYNFNGDWFSLTTDEPILPAIPDIVHSNL